MSDVVARLNALRDEHIRRNRNAIKSRTRAQQHAQPRPQVAEDSTEAWRIRALSFLIPDISSPSVVPSLRDMTLSLIFSVSLPVEILHFIPAHLRMWTARYGAIHHPLDLTAEVLEPLYSNHNGEIIIPGPSGAAALGPLLETAESPEVEDWDAPTEDTSPPPLQTLIIIRAHFPSKVAARLPPTLTHLGLLALTAPLSWPTVSRLLPSLPLLTHLDLSYNPWVGQLVERLSWSGLERLALLGLRECGIDDDGQRRIRDKVNVRGREVAIVFSDN